MWIRLFSISTLEIGTFKNNAVLLCPFVLTICEHCIPNYFAVATHSNEYRWVRKMINFINSKTICTPHSSDSLVFVFSVTQLINDLVVFDCVFHPLAARIHFLVTLKFVVVAVAFSLSCLVTHQTNKKNNLKFYELFWMWSFVHRIVLLVVYNCCRALCANASHVFEICLVWVCERWCN